VSLDQRYALPELHTDSAHLSMLSQSR
jgi:hypothetical protein